MMTLDPMSDETTYSIDVHAESVYLPDQSDPDSERYAFAYTITISNTGTIAAKLLSRHWVITDAEGQIQEVNGDGVVGQQPHLQPGEQFQYTSGTLIETPVGSMRGEYFMRADDGNEFEASIPAFSLAVPHILH